MGFFIFMNYLEKELEYVEKNFNLADVIEFQRKNRTELIVGGDGQYECWINKECFAISLTPLYTLIVGIENYRKDAKTRNN